MSDTIFGSSFNKASISLRERLVVVFISFSISESEIFPRLSKTRKRSGRDSFETPACVSLLYKFSLSFYSHLNIFNA